MLMIVAQFVGNLQPPKHATDMADDTIKTTPTDSYYLLLGHTGSFVANITWVRPFCSKSAETTGSDAIGQVRVL
jgi:hypothetical protein